MQAFHARKLNVHCHCNGNATGQVFVDAIEEVLRTDAWLDHRHVLQHSQTDRRQYRKMGRLGICANIFTNHIWYWGDQHYEQTMGPRARPRHVGLPHRAGNRVPLSFHTDSGVTPVGHLMTMWCAVNRVTPSGRVLGEYREDHPYGRCRGHDRRRFQLHMDHEIGSIEAGKFADFAVLDASRSTSTRWPSAISGCVGHGGRWPGLRSRTQWRLLIRSRSPSSADTWVRERPRC